jgi:hypothetical protein
MTRYGLLCLLLGALAWGQANAPKSEAPQKPATPPGTAAANPESEAATVPPDTPVITIAGLCEKPFAEKTATDCKTVITREQFEKLVEAIQPGMPARMRRQFATRYSNALVMAEKAEQMGLDKGSEYEERMKIARLQVMAQQLNKAMQDKAGDVSDKDIEDYYHTNIARFEQAELDRIYIPKSQQLPDTKPDEKLTEAQEKQRTDAADAAMKTEAEKLHAQAVAGGDFNKLQDQAFQVAGIKSGAPTTSMGKMRRTMLPPDQASVMDLKPGEVSPLITDQNGYFIYRLKSKTTIPLDQAKDEIRGTMRAERYQASMKDIEESAKPTLDEKYFGAPPPPMQRPGMPPMPAPRRAPSKPDSD